METEISIAILPYLAFFIIHFVAINDYEKNLHFQLVVPSTFDFRFIYVYILFELR